jgi:hypothetical protein
MRTGDASVHQFSSAGSLVALALSDITLMLVIDIYFPIRSGKRRRMVGSFTYTISYISFKLFGPGISSIEEGCGGFASCFI